MAGLFTAGDNVQHLFQEALPGTAFVVDGSVLAEVSPGLYQVAVPMGIAVLVPEESLTAPGGEVPVTLGVETPAVEVMRANTRVMQANVEAVQANTEAVTQFQNTDAIVQPAIDAAAVAIQAAIDQLSAALAPAALEQAAIDAAAADIRAAVDKLKG
jgi:hypothetical protein